MRERRDGRKSAHRDQENIKEEKEAAEIQYDSYRREMDSLNKKVKESLCLLETTRQAAEREMYQHVPFQVPVNTDFWKETGLPNLLLFLLFQGMNRPLRMNVASKPSCFR